MKITRLLCFIKYNHAKIIIIVNKQTNIVNKPIKFIKKIYIRSSIPLQRKCHNTTPMLTEIFKECFVPNWGISKQI